jgi:hypothetical protein
MEPKIRAPSDKKKNHTFHVILPENNNNNKKKEQKVDKQRTIILTARTKPSFLDSSQ